MTKNLSKASRVLLSAAAFVIVVAGMKAAAPLLVPFFLSVLIALACSPLLAWLQARGVPTVLAISLIIALIVAAGALIGIIVNASITDFRAELPSYQARLQEMSAAVQQWLAGHGVRFNANQWQKSFDPGMVMQLVGNVLSAFGSVMTNALLILLTVIFILAEETGFRQKMSEARDGSEAYLKAIGRFTASVNRYLGIKTLLSLLTGVLVGIWLWILGVNYPVMWGLLAFVLNFVPTIGSSLAAIPPMLLALIQFNPLYAILVAAGFTLVNFVIDNVLQPRIMGRELDLSTLVVFLSLIFWGWVLGPVGMLLSIPLTILVKIALENDRQTNWLGTMLGAGPDDDEGDRNHA